MLSLHPHLVTFAGQPWPHVTSIAVDRTANREAVEWSDAGPHAVFADVPEQRIDITVTMQLISSNGLDAPRPGQTGDLTFYTAPAATDGARQQVTTQATILATTHDLTGKKGATRTIRLIATSPTGSTDPITTDQA